MQAGTTDTRETPERPARRWLLAFRGEPGSGKSTLSRAVAARLGWPLVDKDDVLDVLEGQHIAGAGSLAYATMFSVARRQLLQGLSVMCDSPFAYRQSYERAVQIVTETHALFGVVECRCPDDAILRQRLEERQTPAAPGRRLADWEAVQAFRRRTAAEVFSITVPHLVLDTLEPVESLCERVVTWLALAEQEQPGRLK